MASPRNKKLLCFIDESISASGDLHFGAVFVPAKEAGRVDKAFSDLLPGNANEIHAVNLEDRTIEGLLAGLHRAMPSPHLLLINRAIT